MNSVATIKSGSASSILVWPLFLLLCMIGIAAAVRRIVVLMAPQVVAGGSQMNLLDVAFISRKALTLWHIRRKHFRGIIHRERYQPFIVFVLVLLVFFLRMFRLLFFWRGNIFNDQLGFARGHRWDFCEGRVILVSLERASPNRHPIHFFAAGRVHLN